MRFAIPYASILLVACIWAMPIAVNHDTLVQRPSGSDLRLKELGLPEVNGPMPFSLEQTVTSDSILEFRITLMVSLTLNPATVKIVKEVVTALIKRGLRKHKICFPIEGLENLSTEELKKIRKGPQVKFEFRFKGLPYSGLLMGSDRGILYRNGEQIYVGAVPVTNPHSHH
ncbi:hypothetical protein BDP27DRAFT_1505747 [Rhodocollybia butyracea]|uniref:Uncharacterized protein n=1 Tax=Rhodocollybia butyracea TaxID=206335 RepID=A0A9P5PRJ4_9AGAR|nr:hypothetical protein BDP27DRAFT_1505747 [Rhodocollybia butyracea]